MDRSIPEQGKTMKTISGRYIVEIYRRDDFVIAKFKTETGPVTIKGRDLPKVKGMEYSFYGTWEDHPKYGRSFKADYFEGKQPTDSQGFVNYMQNLHCGIGKIRAKAIYKKFGRDVWKVIEEEPEQLLTVLGITKKSLERMKKALEGTRVLSTLMQRFGSQQGIDITPAKVRKLTEAFGTNALYVVEQEPYRLCTVRGFSFPMVDRMGKVLQKPADSPERIKAGLQYILENWEAKGNLCCQLDRVIAKAEDILNSGFENQPVTRDKLKAAIKEENKAGNLLYTAGFLYRKDRFIEETEAVDRLKAICFQKMTRYDVRKGVGKYETDHHLKLADCQEKAVESVFLNPLTIVTGGPGTGKSTIIDCILTIHRQIYREKSKPVLLAPTAKAARRMEEVSGVSATTVHFAIGYKGVESLHSIDDSGMIDSNLVIVDEMSMLDQFVFTALLDKILPNTRVVLVGDPDQLPSVGAGEVLNELIKSGDIAVARLDVVFRQKGKSEIIDNALLINSGTPELVKGESYRFTETKSEQETLDKAIDRYLAAVEQDGLENTILLCPFRHVTETNPILAVDHINQIVQEQLNPPGQGKPEMTYRGTIFRTGDRVMQMSNTPRGKNGDTGTVTGVTITSDEDDKEDVSHRLLVQFDSGDTSEYSSDDLNELSLGYATTVHKSQGSEYKNVILVLTNRHRILLTRKLVYTAVTRGRTTDFLIGDLSAYYAAINNDSEEKRNTLLAARIRGAFRSEISSKALERD